MLPETVQLHNGLHMPRVGLGTFKCRGPEARAAVAAALAGGCRLIDTAAIYKNHADVGRALADAKLPRERLWVTTKVSPYQQGQVKARAAVQDALSELGMEYIDLVLIHWPGAARLPHDSPEHARLCLETWRELERLYTQGTLRAIGVSNFEVSHLKALSAHAAVQPMVNQVELHPRFQQRQLREYCAAHGIAVQAYASYACGHLFQDPEVQAVAAAAELPTALMLLRWALGHGAAVIPKSAHPERIRAAAPHRVLQANLPADAAAQLDALEAGDKICWDPRTVKWD